MSKLFFVSWDLWQQMTFVLAMAIVAVFCAGLVKLWWNNRLMEKQEVLDEEKRARLDQMRRTGLPMKRANNVPFGVRAIQKGVEVDGIWISRPPSLNETVATKPAPPDTLADRDSDSQRIGRGNFEGAQPVAPPVSQFAHKIKRPPLQATGALKEDTLQRLEDQAQPKPLYETYVPTSSRQNPGHPRQQSSASSSRDSVASQPQSSKSASGQSHTSSRSSRLHTPRNLHGATPSRFSAFPEVGTHGSRVRQSQAMYALEPAFGPGDFHLNRFSRRVNDGFEVLPAGTFGAPAEVGGTGESGKGGCSSRSIREKVRKSGGQFE